MILSVDGVVFSYPSHLVLNDIEFEVMGRLPGYPRHQWRRKIDSAEVHQQDLEAAAGGHLY